MTRLLAATWLAAALVVAWSSSGEAHKPITSPFTFSDDVLPIVRERCAECHAPGAVAPMSLLTHADAVPWGESIRVELMSGHMPPWGVDTAATRFRNLQTFPARDMNVLLTWASGGTPPGNIEGASPPAAFEPRWTLGTPDATVPLREVTIAADEQQRVEEFVVPAQSQLLRAVDLLPGNPAVVRRATISVRAPEETSPGPVPERLLALWVPGDHPVALDAGAAFQVPAGAELLVRIYYRKTWQYERQAMTDRSTVGLYVAATPATDVQVVRAAASPDGKSAGTTTLSADVRALAIYSDAATTGTHVTVTATRPDGAREELIAFRPREEWTRRYWFREPISLPRGTRITVDAKEEKDDLKPAAAAASPPGKPSLPSIALNVVRAN